jgi:phage shock protein A
MGLIRRLSELFRAKTNTMINEMEDPRETIEYSGERLRELLQDVRRGVADVATSKRRLELQAEKLQQGITKLDEQARQAVAGNREDLARMALERKRVLAEQLQSIDQQRAQLQAEQDKLVLAQQRMSAKLDAFKSHKESIKAQYTAAEAQVRIGEALSGISEEMADVGLAIERAESKTEAMQARAGAIDELLESGALTDLSGGGDDIDRQLGQVTAESDVTAELEALKRELGAGQSVGQLGKGTA